VKPFTAHYPKQHLFVIKKKKGKTWRRSRTCTRETTSFPFSLWKHYWTGCRWAVCDEFRLVCKCEACVFQTGSSRFKLTCHMNKTIHTLTTITIKLELSGRGPGRWYERCGGWNKNPTSLEHSISLGVGNRRAPRKTRVMIPVMDQAGGPCTWHDWKTPWRRHAIDWCCFDYFVRNSLVAWLEALLAQNIDFKM